MGQMIHCRIRNGEKKYKVWSTTVDAYVTKELTLKELRNLLLKEEISRVRANFVREFPERVARAEDRGTSSLMGEEPVALDGPWKESLKQAEPD